MSSNLFQLAPDAFLFVFQINNDCVFVQRKQSIFGYIFWIFDSQWPWFFIINQQLFVSFLSSVI